MNPLDKQKLVETTKETGNKAGILKTAIIGAALLSSTQVRADDLLKQCDFYKDGIAQKLTRKEISIIEDPLDQEAAKKENSCIISFEREQRTEEREQRTEERKQRTEEREKWKQRFDMTLALLTKNEAKKFLEDKIKDLDIEIEKEVNNKIKGKLILERKILQERLDKLGLEISIPQKKYPFLAGEIPNGYFDNGVGKDFKEDLKNKYGNDLANKLQNHFIYFSSLVEDGKEDRVMELFSMLLAHPGEQRGYDIFIKKINKYSNGTEIDKSTFNDLKSLLDKIGSDSAKIIAEQRLAIAEQDKEIKELEEQIEEARKELKNLEGERKNLEGERKKLENQIDLLKQKIEERGGDLDKLKNALS